MCKCGAKILQLPDVKAMGKAIDVHIASHLEGVRGQPCTTLEADRLRDALIIQILRIAGESEGKESHEEFELKDKFNERKRKKPEELDITCIFSDNQPYIKTFPVPKVLLIES